MPSHSWHLIRPGSESPAAAEPALVVASAGQAPKATVLRARGKGGTRLATAQSAEMWQAGGPEDATDPDSDAESIQLREIQAEAEQRGYEEGLARAEQELGASIAAAGALADRIASLAPERTAEIAHAVTELALHVARRILAREVEIDPTLLCAQLESAVGTINGSPRAHVMLNPAAVAPVKEAWEARHGLAFLGKKWIFEGDPTLPPGGCTLRYDHGFVEAGLESQLEEIGIALDRAIPAIARNTVDEVVA